MTPPKTPWSVPVAPNYPPNEWPVGSNHGHYYDEERTPLTPCLSPLCNQLVAKEHPDWPFGEQPRAERKCQAKHPSSPAMTACHRILGHLGEHETLSPLGAQLWRWRVS